jgi:hypothetical protein
MPDDRFDDRFEADLRDALRLELASVRVGVAGPQVRGRISARERTRRMQRLVLLAAAAVLAVAVAIPVLGGLVLTGPLAPAPTSGGVEPATVAAIEAGSGDLVLSRAWPDGRSEIVASYAGALDLLRQASGDARASRLPDGAVATAGPERRLAVGLPRGDVLVFTGRPSGGAFVSRPLDGPRGATWLGWAKDGRLAIIDDRRIVRLVDPATAHETTSALPEGVYPEFRRLDGPVLLTWNDDGLVAARRSDAATFQSEPGVVDITAERPTFVPGRPDAIRATTGVEPLEAPDGSAPTGWSPDTEAGGTASGIAAMGSGDGTEENVRWYVARRGERVFDQTWTADHGGLVVVAGRADGSDGRLLLLDGPGSWRDAVTFAGAPGTVPRLVGVAPGGRAVAVTSGGGLVVGDLASGAATTLPAGTVFVDWGRSAVVALDALPSLPPCEATTPAIASTIALSEAGTTTPASSGSPAVMGSRIDDVNLPAGSDPWRRDELASATPVTASADGTLVLALPAGTCVEAVSAEAVPAGDSAAASGIQLATQTAGTLTVGGLYDITAPPAGEWIVRVKLWLVGPSAETILLYRVDAASPGASPGPSASPPP